MGDTAVTARPVALYNATPTLLVDGQSRSIVDVMLLAMEMSENNGGLTSMELRFSNFGTFDAGAGYVFEDDAILKLGASIDVRAGDRSAPTSIFTGRISAIEGRFSPPNEPQLVVLAEDAMQRARMARRSKIYENVTLDRLVSELAQSVSLTPVTSGLSTTVGTHVQFNESDLAFVRRILARYDADLQVVGTELHAAPRAQIQRNQIELSLSRKLRRARVIADLSHQVTRIQFAGWDFQQGQVASSSSSGNVPPPGSGTSGADILRNTFGERNEQLSQVSVRDSQEARALVDAEWEQRSRRFVVIHGTAEGNPELRVGSYVKVTELGPRFSNTYAVTATTHRYDQTRGYETDFTAECAFLGPES